ncbi:GAF and ANTAR domain-containing protein [Streptomyces flavidovirens]|uniref:GAF and ANTAR domain-containing protein n=1 Tax=Streptomyces flavidovirens TaxID=67298 RepID=A0ABW6RKF7_9ACTN
MSGTDSGAWESFGERLAEMARDLLAQESVQQTLDRIGVHAVNLVDGCEDAGILTIDRGEVATLSATSDLVRDSDRLQGEVGQGPCYDATRHHERVYRIRDTEHESRWPLYVPEARKLGIGSMIGFLLYTADDNLGALNLYSPHPGAFTDRSEQIGWLLASHAAVAFSSARTHAQLNTALETRHEIGEAIGILMGRHKLTEDQAFAVLRKASQEHNIKLRDIARTVTETGDTPTS